MHCSRATDPEDWYVLSFLGQRSTCANEGGLAHDVVVVQSHLDAAVARLVVLNEAKDVLGRAQYIAQRAELKAEYADVSQSDYTYRPSLTSFTSLQKNVWNGTRVTRRSKRRFERGSWTKSRRPGFLRKSLHTNCCIG